MNCPPIIARVLLQILHTGILRIRAGGWAGDAERCAAEADHLHNLPGLLVDFSFDRLKYYWDVERPAFLHRSDGTGAEGFEPLWRDLERCLSHETAPFGE
jgi:hypothetical protein